MGLINVGSDYWSRIAQGNAILPSSFLLNIKRKVRVNQPCAFLFYVNSNLRTDRC